MFDAEVLVQETSSLFGELPSMENLGNWVFERNWLDYNFEAFLPDFESDEAYCRRILTLEPVEIALLRWKPGAESAVHHHAGFWGYVVCLSGQLEHHGYALNSGTLEQVEQVIAFAGGILPEADGTIHRLINGNDDEELLTLHIYAPPLESLDGLELFDLKCGDIYTCSESAPAALLGLAPQHYKRVAQAVFSFQAIHSQASHVITPLVPKPNSQSIADLLADYYKAQAKDYDEQDETDDQRRLYTSGINACISDRLKRLVQSGSLKCALHVGCGTGRRALEIKDLSGLEYQLLGSDINPHMARIAAKRGIQMIDGFWEGDQRDLQIDAVCFLYAFSHLDTKKARQKSLKTMFHALRPGGLMCLDVFNLDDPYEWGPALKSDFEKWNLAQQGYDLGDVFYSRSGSNQLAYLHYTTDEQMVTLLSEAGFEAIECIQIGYGHQPGNEVDEGGSLLFFAKKPLL